MKGIVKLTAIPPESIAMDGFGTIDYFDAYRIEKPTCRSIVEVSKDLMRMPGWAVALFKLRNAIVRMFGLKADRTTESRETFFTLIEEREDEIVMGESDKHLDFRASVIRDKERRTITVITLVHFNNVWGKVYFLPVKPFHQLIMKTMLKRYLNAD